MRSGSAELAAENISKAWQCAIMSAIRKSFSSTFNYYRQVTEKFGNGTPNLRIVGSNVSSRRT